MLSFEAAVSLTILLMFLPVITMTYEAHHMDTAIYEHMLVNDIIESYYKTGDIDSLSTGHIGVLNKMETTAKDMGYCLEITAKEDLAGSFSLGTLAYKDIFSKEITPELLDKLLSLGHIDSMSTDFKLQGNTPLTQPCEDNYECIITQRTIPTYGGQHVVLYFKLCPE